MRFLPFEEADERLLPWSARRALDRAGLKLSLAGWQALSFPVRETIAALGEEDDVDPERVASLLDAVETQPIDRVPDPPVDRIPEAITALLGERPLGEKRWRAISIVARFALARYAEDRRADRLHAAYDALFGRS